MALVLTHPDYAHDPHLASAWQSLLEEFRDDDTAWKGLPREVAGWWRRRASSVVRPGVDGWRIDGPAATEGAVHLSEPAGPGTAYVGEVREVPTDEDQEDGAVVDLPQALRARCRGRICIVRHDHYLDLT